MDEIKNLLVSFDRTLGSISSVDYSTKNLSEFAKIHDAKFSNKIASLVGREFDGTFANYHLGVKTIFQKANSIIYSDLVSIIERDGENVLRELSIPRFFDIHSAFEDEKGNLVVSNTGREEFLVLDWEGNILHEIDCLKLFNLPMKKTFCGRSYADSRFIYPFSYSESLHANWAMPLGNNLILGSALKKHKVFITTYEGELMADIDVGKMPHAPFLCEESFFVCLSGEKCVAEYDYEGKELWRSEARYDFSKKVAVLPNGNIIISSTQDKRLTELNPQKEFIRDIALPENPYDVQVLGTCDLQMHYLKNHKIKILE